jgi:hypothetical protein
LTTDPVFFRLAAGRPDLSSAGAAYGRILAETAPQADRKTIRVLTGSHQGLTIGS